MSDGWIRAFVGIPIGNDDAKTLQTAVTPLIAQLGDRVRWIKREDWHLTLCFLGQVDPGARGALAKVVRQESENIIKFSVKINKLSPFPSVKSRLIAAVVEKNDILNLLFANITQAAEKHNIKCDKKVFIPHISLAKSAQVMTDVEVLTMNDLVLTAHELVLFESLPDQAEAHYRAIERFPLA